MISTVALSRRRLPSRWTLSRKRVKRRSTRNGPESTRSTWIWSSRRRRSSWRSHWARSTWPRINAHQCDHFASGARR